MKLINRKQGIVSCAGYTFPNGVPIDVPDDLAKRLLEKQSLLLEIYEEVKDAKEKVKEEKK